MMRIDLTVMQWAGGEACGMSGLDGDFYGYVDD